MDGLLIENCFLQAFIKLDSPTKGVNGFDRPLIDDWINMSSLALLGLSVVISCDSLKDLGLAQAAVEFWSFPAFIKLELLEIGVNFSD